MRGSASHVCRPARGRAARVVVLALVLVLLVVFGLAGTAVARPGQGNPHGQGACWPDLTHEILKFYDVTPGQLLQFSQGYPDGTWRPYVEIQRAQLVAAVVIAFDMPLVNPPVPTYLDVPPTHPFYQHIEAATAAGLVMGVSPGYFAPSGLVMRQQGALLLTRVVLAETGWSLADMYTDEEVDELLSAYPDQAGANPALRPALAFATDFEIIRADEEGNLSPQGTLTRIEAASMIVHAQEALKHHKHHHD